jgi:very-short-patch-repair endonuclease
MDIANKEKMIGIELDGTSHSSLERRAQDIKKTEFLISQGWSIYRVSNTQALNLYSTFKSVDTLLTSLMGN